MAGRARFSGSTQRLAAAVLCSLAIAACQPKPHLSFDPPLVCRVPGPVVESAFLIGDAGAPELPDPTSADSAELVEPVLVALVASAIVHSQFEVALFQGGLVAAIPLCEVLVRKHVPPHPPGRIHQ